MKNNDSIQTEEQKVEAGTGLAITELATLPEKAILDEARMASIFAVTPRTVRRMVDRGELPPSFRLAGRANWFSGIVVNHLFDLAKKKLNEARDHQKKIAKYSP